MYYYNRKFITGKDKESFLNGVKLGLTKTLAKKVELVRLSIKKENFYYVVHSLWGRKNKAVGQIFKCSLTGHLPSTPEELDEQHWKYIGETIGSDMVNWAENDVEFERSDVKALAVQFDVWKTSEWHDVIQDMLDEVELQNGLHLGSKLHWRVRKALSDRIEALILQQRQANIQDIDTRTVSNVLKTTAKREMA